MLTNKVSLMGALVLTLVLAEARGEEMLQDNSLAEILADWDNRRDRIGAIRYQISGLQTLL